jgi:ABC-2 type transport system permease protein
MMKKYLIILKTSLLTELEYRGLFISDLVIHLIGIGMTYFVYSYIVSEQGQIGRYDLETMLVYYILSVFFINSFGTSTIKRLERSINQGGLSILLQKPLKPILSLLFRELGQRFVTYVIGFIVILIPIIAIPQLQNSLYLSWLNIFLVIIIVLLANIFLFFFNFLLGTLAFWLKSISGVRNIAWNIVNILRGSWFPIDIAPVFVQSLLSYLPFQYALYYPIKMLTTQEHDPDYLKGVIVLLSFSFLFFILTQLLWKKGLKKFSAVGG